MGLYGHLIMVLGNSVFYLLKEDYAAAGLGELGEGRDISYASSGTALTNKSIAFSRHYPKNGR